MAQVSTERKRASVGVALNPYRAFNRPPRPTQNATHRTLLYRMKYPLPIARLVHAHRIRCPHSKVLICKSTFGPVNEILHHLD